MYFTQFSFTVATEGRGSYAIDHEINRGTQQSEMEKGLAHIFIHHTSASLMICENADPAVRQDLETFMADLVPDGDSRFIHQDEGPDDMPAHIRSILTQPSLSVPVTMGKLALGTWQSVYLWEHRTVPHQRRITVSLTGDFYVP
ncbi:MAG TPA: YjbQ family protein [Chromatiales bacterium]|nr:YjbQ family protein [Thiotrichales bacterium]HIP67516.1 YjbQ family protein [Chromatiales bacterium]